MYARVLTVFFGLAIVMSTMPGLGDGKAWGIDKAKTLKIYWVDVEGGAATLLVTPAGESILIDTGMPGKRHSGRIAKLARKVAGLKQIDHLVVTHFDIDHYGGAADLAKLIPVVNLYDHGYEEGDRVPPKSYREMKVRKRIVLKPGDEMKVKQVEGLPKLKIRCLVAKQKFVKPGSGAKRNALYKEEPPKKNKDRSHNANSIVLLFSLGKFDFLDAADLTHNLEGRLVWPYNLVGIVDVYQVNHHGLSSSNNPALIKSIRPTVAVMNNGHRKGCSTSTVKALRSTDSIKAIYQMHKNLRKDGATNNTKDEYIANLTREESAVGNYIKLTVGKTGGGYEVAVPARKHKREYVSK